MHRYTYITRLKDSDRFYVGRHESVRDPALDRYVGSGRWVRSIADKTRLHREILESFDNSKDLLAAEQKLIEQHISNPNCMNFNLSPVGFSTGDLNPSKSDLRRAAFSERWRGENNPSFGGLSEEKKQRIAASQVGKRFSHTEATKIKLSEKRKLFRYSDEQKKHLSEQRKGKPANCSFNGHSHSIETLEKMSASHKNRPKIMCPHCGKESAKNVYVQWHGDKCKHK